MSVIETWPRNLLPSLFSLHSPQARGSGIPSQALRYGGLFLFDALDADGVEVGQLRTSARISHGSMLAFQSLSIASLLDSGRSGHDWPRYPRPWRCLIVAVLNSAHRREHRQAARAAEAGTGLKRICGPSATRPETAELVSASALLQTYGTMR